MQKISRESLRDPDCFLKLPCPPGNTFVLRKALEPVSGKWSRIRSASQGAEGRPRRRTKEMTTRVQGGTESCARRTEISQEWGASEGEALGLYEALARIGPATVYGLAREALVPRTYVYRWLETQAQAGYVHRDTHSGRYSLWCETG
jgi:Sugar-specific transcriptional regulator TrmB